MRARNSVVLARSCSSDSFSISGSKALIWATMGSKLLDDPLVGGAKYFRECLIEKHRNLQSSSINVMNCSDWDERRSARRGGNRCAGAERSGEARRRTLEERGKQRHCGRTAQASDGCDRKQSEGRDQPDKQHGKHRDQRSGAGITQPRIGLAPGTEICEPQDTGMRGEILTLTPGQELEYRVRVGFGALQTRLGSSNRRECDGGNCHPHPSAFVASPRHFKHPYHILPQMPVPAVEKRRIFCDSSRFATRWSSDSVIPFHCCSLLRRVN